MLVDVDERARRHGVLRIGAQDLAVDLDGALGVAELLAVDLRDPAQDLVAVCRVGLLRRLALEQRRHAVPVLRLEQHAALRLARARVLRLQLLDALPGRERPVGVAQVLLGDDGDLLEAAHQVLGGAAARARAIEGELEQVGQRDPVALLAEVIGVGGERDRVLGLDLQHGVQVHGRLVAIAEAVAVDRGELEHDAHARSRLFDDAQLPLAQLGELGVLVAGRRTAPTSFSDAGPPGGSSAAISP